MNNVSIRHLLVLFPTDDEKAAISFFSSRGYIATILTLDKDSIDLNGIELSSDSMVIQIPDDAVLYLNELSDDQQKRLISPDMVLFHAGKDVLSPRVEGEGYEWRLQKSQNANVITNILEWLLHELRSPETTLWVNFFTGEHGKTALKYCAGRYVLAGFEAALRLTPRLQKLRILNVCLTYFKDQTGMHGCEHCLTRGYAPEIMSRGGDTDALYKYIVELRRSLEGS